MKKLFLTILIIGFVYIAYLNRAIFYEYPEGVRNTLKYSNETQKAEFEKVLEYFNKEEDNLKLKCAQVLISNIPLYSYKKEPETFNQVVDSIHSLKNKLIIYSDSLKYNKRILKKVQDIFVDKMNFLCKTNEFFDKEEVRDIDTLSSSFLIENINLAFEAHYKLPKKYRTNFNDFCNYVLPYRNDQEPLEFHKRKELYEKYSWVYDSIKTKPLEDIIIQIYDDLKINIDFKKLSKLDLSPTYSQIEKLQYGLCRDVTNYFVLLFRSLGFAAGTDYITTKGNRHSPIGHNWFFIMHDNTFLPIQARSKSLIFSDIDKIFKLTNMPKVYRNVFNKVNLKNLAITKDTDVTSLYRPTSTVQIKNIFQTSYKEDYKLCVFNRKSNWFEVDESFKLVNNKVTFNNVGRGIVYAVTNSFLEPINYPFYLDYKGNLMFLKNKNLKEDKPFNITRKYPPIDLPNKWKTDRIKALNNCKLQGSNYLDENSFKDIYTIKNFCSTQKNQFLFKKEEKYKYYRLIAEEGTSYTSYIAEFALINMDLKPIENVKIDFYGTKESKLKQKSKITDNDPLTFGRFLNMKITFEVENSQNVSGFEIQARNDDNHINIGEEYELRVFDKTWKRVRKEKAKDTVLNYESLAKDGLYILHNLTKGKEETVFTFDENGNQFWFGVSDVNDLGVGAPMSMDFK
ncbi:hypothetical protein [Algibacter sp. R77976]|uniref:hypothetical protein n=1 Tax=Algibacter sp. R77976 TaxID=3093873 RepID=UPI0037C673E0